MTNILETLGGRKTAKLEGGKSTQQFEAVHVETSEPANLVAYTEQMSIQDYALERQERELTDGKGEPTDTYRIATGWIHGGLFIALLPIKIGANWTFRAKTFGGKIARGAIAIPVSTLTTGLLVFTPPGWVVLALAAISNTSVHSGVARVTNEYKVQDLMH